MILMRSFVAIVLTKLQRFESRANVKKTYHAAQMSWTAECEKKVGGFGKILHGRRVENSTLISNMTSVLTIRASGVRFGLEISAPAAYYVFFTFALLSERCNFVKMIATKLFIRIFFVKNFMQNIFGNLIFFSKVHISRENREKVISGQPFYLVHEGEPSWGRWVLFGNIWGHASELPTIKLWVAFIYIIDPSQYGTTG